MVTYNHGLKKPVEGLDVIPDDVRISYSDRARRFAEGMVSYEEVIAPSHRMISAYPKLARIIADRYPYIFVDEYQDTFLQTIELLPDHILGSREGEAVVGLFGDSMQKIYSAGVGAVSSDKLLTITKHENYRCSPPVIGLLNKIRPSLVQYPDAAAFTPSTASSPWMRR